MRLIIKLVIVLLLVGAAVCFYPPLRLAAFVLVGRASVCPFHEAIKSADNLKQQIAIKDRILGASHLLQKDPAGFHLWDTPKGRYWIPEGDDWVLPFNLAEQERRIYGTGEHAVRAGDIVLDCGANVGVFTRLALDAGAKLVVSIEIAPENIESLRRNFQQEVNDHRVIVYPKGVWDKDDTLTLNVAPKNSAADSVVMKPDDSHPGARVPLTTVDKIAAELKLERVDFIKMDIEGAEAKALTGARNTLATYHPRLAIATEHNPNDAVALPAVIRNAWPGYTMECGPCLESSTFIRPDVLYFY